MHTVHVRDTEVAYRRAGDGIGLVLLHGTNSDGASGFGHLVDRFTDRRTVITPDYAGAGHSTVPDGPLSLDLLVDQVAAVISDAGDSPVDLLGTSLGAVVAAATAASRPGLVRRLVLVAGWVSSRDARHRLVFETWKRLQDLDPELSTRFGMSLAFSPHFLSGLGPERVSALTTRRFPADTDRRIDLGLRIDLEGVLPRITAPTLVIGLTQDALVPVDHSRALHKMIPVSRYAEIDSGHAVQLERPKELTRLARAFLLESGPASRSEALTTASPPDSP
ncbi:alpha/beta fold hydrolase [Actinomadura nitritigenes]|uniref:alpha/beta fold hydrolase n=1 Tax=Actinomadura nitritigenes TaxID=134602 RepID=UPI003D926B76